MKLYLLVQPGAVSDPRSTNRSYKLRWSAYGTPGRVPAATPWWVHTRSQSCDWSKGRLFQSLPPSLLSTFSGWNLERLRGVLRPPQGGEPDIDSAATVRGHLGHS